jgi:hypothetical protein
MAFWNKTKPVEQAVQSLVHTPQIPTEFVKQYLRARGLKVGSWVKTQSGVGIVTGLDGLAVAVDLTDEGGFTKSKTVCDAATVRKAKLSELPKARVNLERARQLGYED